MSEAAPSRYVSVEALETAIQNHIHTWARDRKKPFTVAECQKQLRYDERVVEKVVERLCMLGRLTKI